MVNHSHLRSWWGMQEAEQRIIRCQGDWSHSPCPLRASGTEPALWSATGCDIYSHFHRIRVGSHPNATWEFLGLISSWLKSFLFEVGVISTMREDSGGEWTPYPRGSTSLPPPIFFLPVFKIMLVIQLLSSRRQPWWLSRLQLSLKNTNPSNPSIGYDDSKFMGIM